MLDLIRKLKDLSIVNAFCLEFTFCEQVRLLASLSRFFFFSEKVLLHFLLYFHVIFCLKALLVLVIENIGKNGVHYGGFLLVLVWRIFVSAGTIANLSFFGANILKLQMSVKNLIGKQFLLFDTSLSLVFSMRKEKDFWFRVNFFLLQFLLLRDPTVAQ